MIRSLLAFAGILCLASSSMSSLAQGAESPTPLFYLSFDEGFNAKAKGNGAPTNTDRLPTLVDGIYGKAAQFDAGHLLRYAAKDNLQKSSGTLALWAKMPVSGSGVPEVRYTLFREDGPNGLGTNMTWLWLHGGTGMRFDVRDPSDMYTYIPWTDGWKRGEWHYIVTTWDSNSGLTIYVDGALVAEQAVGFYKPKIYDGFYLGAFDGEGIQPWGSAIDEVAIYDRPLTREEVRANFLRYGKFSSLLQLVDPFLTVGKPGNINVALKNSDTAKATVGALNFTLVDKDGKTVQSGKLPDQVIAGDKTVLVKTPVTLPASGTYSYTLSYQENGATKTFTGVITGVPETIAPATTPTKLTLVTEVDASKREPLAEIGKSVVVESPLGAYREAGPAMRDRFAMDFDIVDVGQPHVAVFTFPDDKPRTIEVLLQDLKGAEPNKSREYQAQTGVFSGDEYALTGKMLEHRVVFWPHSTKQSFIFMTAEKGHPVALKEMKIYRMDHFAAVPVKPFTGSVPARNIGLYYEDPVLHSNFGVSSDLAGFTTAANRLFDYMQSFGQNVFCYPVVWYHGPLFGTLVESRQPDTGGEIAGDRPHPYGYPAYLLKNLQARGMKFNAGLHIHFIPSLNPYTITDVKRVVKGEETVVNMQADGTLGWGHYHGADPNYNPIDPRVTKAVKDMVDEVGDRYGQEPAFEGVTLVMARVKLFQFGSIRSGYNDSNLQAFQKEMGIKIPDYDLSKSKRFSESYKWIMANPEVKKAWIDWRCQKLHDHYKQVADSLSAKRPDLKLTLNLFMPLAYYSRVSNYLNEQTVEILRETGIDPKLYAGDSNIVLSYTFVPAELRWRRSLDDKTPDIERNRTSMLAPEATESLRALPQTSAILHDRYWEDAVGRTNPLKISKEPNVKECVWRVSTLNAPAFHAMEPYVAALNNIDALEITKGGFLIGTYGMEDYIKDFSQQYRALPAVRFDDVPGVEDPVRVRQKVVDGKLYFYVLNRIPAPVDVTLKLAENGDIEEAATGKSLPAGAGLSVKLAPYGLKVYRSASAKQRVTGGQTTPDKEWLAKLQGDLERIKKNVDASAKKSAYLSFAEDCWSKGKLARLYFLLQESWANNSKKNGSL